MAQGLSKPSDLAAGMEGVRSLAILVGSGILVMALMPGAIAVTSVSLDSGLSHVVVVAAGSFQAYRIFLSDVETLRVDVRSLSETLIDVYVLNSTNFLAYVRGSASFEWIDGASVENAPRLLVDFRPTQDGNYYVVVDNQVLSPSGATPVAAVEASVALGPVLATVEPSWAAVLGLVGIGLALVVVLAVTFVRPGWHERPWIRRSWTGPVPAPRTVPGSAGDDNGFRDTPPGP